MRYFFNKDLFYQFLKKLGALSLRSRLPLSGSVAFGAVLLLSFCLSSGLGCQSRIERQIYNLQDQYASRRMLTVEALSKIDDERTIEPLIAALKDKDPDVVWRAAAALGDKGNNRAIEPLITTLKHNDLAVQHFVAAALVKIGEPAVKPLITVLKNTNPDSFRVKAITVLGKISNKHAVEPLIATLKYTGSDAMRAAAAIALGKIGDKRAVEPLILALKDMYSILQYEAATALVKIGEPAVEPLITVLKLADTNITRAAAAIALGKIGDKRAVEPLILALKDMDSILQYEAATALVKIGEPAVEPLITRLKDASDLMIIIVIRVLGNIGDKRAVLPLIAALKNKDPGVVSRAATALGNIGDKRAVLPLIGAFKDENPSVQKSAIDVLVKIGTPAVKHLITALKNKEPVVQKSAADVLIKIGAPAVEPLVVALNDEDPEVQELAMYVLLEIGDPAVNPLIALLKDNEDPEVEKAAIDALVKIGDSAVEPLIAALRHESVTIRIASATALGRIGDKRAVQSLVKALTDWKVRRSAAMALDSLEWKPVIPSHRIHYLYAKGQKNELLNEWELTNKILLSDMQSGIQESIQNAVYAYIDLRGNDIIPELIKMLESDSDNIIAKAYVNPLIAALNHEDPEMQKSAADVLVTIGSPAVEALVAILKDADSDAIRVAAIALGNIGDNQAVNPLIALLKDNEDPEVEKAAIDALVKIGDSAVEPLIAALRHESVTIRIASATALGRIGDKRAVQSLVKALTDWKVRRSAAMALDSLEWKPVIPSHRIHYLYAKGQKNELLNEWELTNKILLSDMQSGIQESIQNAVYAYIDLRGNDIIPELIKMLESNENIFIAQVYLDSGNQRLMDAAIKWADRHGFNMVSESDSDKGVEGRRDDRTSQ